MQPARAALSSVSADSLADVTYRSLRDAITAGDLAAGAELNEVKLAAELGVSRTPLRDAIRRLREEGLVDQPPRRLARVREFAAQDFIDIYNARLALEPAAVRLCVQSKADLSGARRVLKLMETAPDPASISLLEHEFHAELVLAAGNPVLARSYASIGAQLRTALAANPPTSHPLRTVVAAHKALLRAIESGVERAAFDAIEAHILDAVEGALEALNGGEKTPLSPTAELYR